MSFQFVDGQKTKQIQLIGLKGDSLWGTRPVAMPARPAKVKANMRVHLLPSLSSVKMGTRSAGNSNDPAILLVMKTL